MLCSLFMESNIVYQGVIYYQWEEILHSGAFEIKLSEQIVHMLHFNL